MQPGCLFPPKGPGHAGAWHPPRHAHYGGLICHHCPGACPWVLAQGGDMAIHRVLSWRDPTTHTWHSQVPGFADRYAERASIRHSQNPRMVHPRIPGIIRTWHPGPMGWGALGSLGLSTPGLLGCGTSASPGWGTQGSLGWGTPDQASQDPQDGAHQDPWDLVYFGIAGT